MPRRPKRPAHTGLSGLSGLDLFGKTKHESRSRASAKKYLHLHSRGDSVIPPVPSLPPPQMMAPILPYDAASAVGGHRPGAVTASFMDINHVHNPTASHEDSAKIIETQRGTISRLLEELAHTDKISEQLKQSENGKLTNFSAVLVAKVPDIFA